MRRRSRPESTEIVPTTVDVYPGGYEMESPGVDNNAVALAVADAVQQTIAAIEGDVKIVNLTVNVNVQVANGGGASNVIGGDHVESYSR